MKNKQLTSAQRHQNKNIALLLQTDRSAVYRELKRNTGKQSYRARFAQELCDEHKERYLRGREFSLSIEKMVREKITREQWSPEQIVDYCFINQLPMVSHERIYL